jgi:hypothetical protein
VVCLAPLVPAFAGDRYSGRNSERSRLKAGTKSCRLKAGWQVLNR